MEDIGLLCPAVIHDAVTGFQLVDHSLKSREHREKFRQACNFFAINLDLNENPPKLTRQLIKKAYMRKLRDSHPDTASSSSESEVVTTSIIQTKNEPSIAQIKIHYDILLNAMNENNADKATGKGYQFNIQKSTTHVLLQKASMDDTVCSVCLRAFHGVVNLRKHHCRRCGQSVCTDCSPDLRPLPEYGFSKPVRQCTACVADPNRFAAGISSSMLAITDQVSNDYLRF